MSAPPTTALHCHRLARGALKAITLGDLVRELRKDLSDAQTSSLSLYRRLGSLATNLGNSGAFSVLSSVTEYLRLLRGLIILPAAWCGFELFCLLTVVS